MITMNMNIPRRIILDQNTDLEIDIRIIISRIEKMPAHPSLTGAIMNLQEAFEHLADYNDQNASKQRFLNTLSTITSKNKTR